MEGGGWRVEGSLAFRSKPIWSRSGLKLTIRFINNPHVLSTVSRACCRRGHRQINPSLEFYWWPSPLKALFHASSPRETPTTVVRALERAPGFSRALGSTPARAGYGPGTKPVRFSQPWCLEGSWCFRASAAGAVLLLAGSRMRFTDAPLSVMSRVPQCWMRKERHGLEYLLTLHQELESREGRSQNELRHLSHRPGDTKAPHLAADGGHPTEEHERCSLGQRAAS